MGREGNPDYYLNGIELSHSARVVLTGAGGDNGRALINGNGKHWWNKFLLGKLKGGSRPRLVSMLNNSDPLVENLHLVNSPEKHLMFNAVRGEARFITVEVDRKYQQELKRSMTARRFGHALAPRLDTGELERLSSSSSSSSSSSPSSSSSFSSPSLRERVKTTKRRWQVARCHSRTFLHSRAICVWARLTSDEPVSGIRETVRAGREEMRNTLLITRKTSVSKIRLRRLVLQMRTIIAYLMWANLILIASRMSKSK